MREKEMKVTSMPSTMGGPSQRNVRQRLFSEDDMKVAEDLTGDGNDCISLHQALPLPLLEANGRNKSKGFVYEVNRKEEVSFVAILILSLSLVIIFLTFAFPQVMFSNLQVKPEDNHMYLNIKGKKLIYLVGMAMCTFVATLLGITCCAFSCMVTYFDSHKPGRFPPTPMSPSKYRQRSGHTFHSSYIISIVNGLAVFLYVIWWSRHSFLFTNT